MGLGPPGLHSLGRGCLRPAPGSHRLPRALAQLRIEDVENVLKATLFAAWDATPPGRAQQQAGEAGSTGQGDGAGGRQQQQQSQRDECWETWSDRVHLTSLISAYLPFLPLERPHVSESENE